MARAVRMFGMIIQKVWISGGDRLGWLGLLGWLPIIQKVLISEGGR